MDSEGKGLVSEPWAYRPPDHSGSRQRRAGEKLVEKQKAGKEEES